MYWRNKAALAVVLYAAAGCSLIDLETAGIESHPGERGEQIAASEELWIKFSSEPEHAGAEQLLLVSSHSGNVTGDLRWEGSTLFFKPEPELKPGVRYLLSYNGTVSFVDGRSYEAFLQLPFYAGGLEARPILLEHFPRDGDFIDPSSELRFGFSCPMDTVSFRRNLILDPATEFDVTWNDDASIATLVPRDGWRNLRTYTWTVSGELLARCGVETGT